MDLKISISKEKGQGRTEFELICDAVTALSVIQRELSEEYLRELSKVKLGSASNELSNKIELLLAEGNTLTLILEKLVNA